VVQKRTLEWEGGNPGTGEGSDWSHFIRRKGEGDGALNIGMTNEIARTGKQSIYFDFADITGKRFVARLMTQFITVKPGHPYKVGMWGRMDKERPLTLDQRRPFVRMEFEYYKEDEETQVGETDTRTMQIPGSPKRLLFNSSQWTQAYGVVRAPAGAALMKVSYEFNVRNEPGRTDGIIFFDDAFVEELQLDHPIETTSEIVVKTDPVGPEPAAVKEDPAKAPLPNQ